MAYSQFTEADPFSSAPAITEVDSDPFGDTNDADSDPFDDGSLPFCTVHLVMI